MTVSLKKWQACGTYAAYQRHRRRAQKPCQPCCDAASKYHRDLRRKSATVREAANRQGRIASRALHRLRQRHEAEYRALYKEELYREWRSA
jgi:hypothetical protein